MRLPATAPIAERPLESVDLPVPEPGAGEILVRVSVCGVCRTDLHVIEGELADPALPLIPGHQVVGRVERCGPGCERFAPGDRVGIAWLRGTCGVCDHCRSGRENLCTRSVYTGYQADGGYAEFAVVPEAFAYAIPERFDDAEAAPLLCAGIIGYRALRRASVPAGGRLALYGFGSSAHVVIQLARHRGHEVYVATRGEGHRALAAELGAVWTGDAYARPPVAVDSAIIFAPVGAMIPVALRAVGAGGTVVSAGIHMSPIPEMPYDECVFHEKVLTSVEANTRDDGRELLAEAAEIPIRPRVTTFPLEEANEALIQLKGDGFEGTAVLDAG
jgi:propanol-preferring alcohol dehydrogenase